LTWCGEGQLRTPKYENRKSCFFLCLEFRFSEQNGEIQPEKVTRKIARKKVCIINHLYFLAERGGLQPLLLRGRGRLVSVGMSLVFNAAFQLGGIGSVYEGSNDPQIGQN
jgi:hypothetical protein